MGALDAAELPPTFGIAPSRVQAIVAGGARALSRAVEGAEDNPEAGPWELRKRGLGGRSTLNPIVALEDRSCTDESDTHDDVRHNTVAISFRAGNGREVSKNEDRDNGKESRTKGDQGMRP